MTGLWELFTRIAQRSADAVAVRDEQHVYTYADTVRLCRNGAAALAAIGVAPGDAVIISTDHTSHGVLAMLSVLAANATPVPVEPDGPVARLRRVAAASAASAALVDHVGLSAIGPSGLPTLLLTDAVATATNPASGVGASDLAYILFTSGSTGEPKGVEVTQANVLALLAGAAVWDTSTHEDVWACFHAFTFDVSMWEIWRPLSLGAQVYVLPRAAQVDLALAYSLIDARGVTSLCLTPTAAGVLIRQIVERGVPGALRRLLIAGERLAFGTLRPLQPAMDQGQLEVWNVYGPTETTVYATAHRVTAEETIREPRSLIGRALPAVDAVVHDPADDGVGELWLSGEQVAAGYRGDVKLTAERFVIDGNGRRWYRTGDLARQAPDGRLEFIGRAGGFVKVRGFRVEPGDVVAAVTSHPAVTEAAAVAVELPVGATLVCAVVRDPDIPVTEIELRRHLAGSLPTYMRPGRIVFVDRLPRLSSSKLDEHGLRDMVAARLDVAAPSASCETAGSTSTAAQG